MPVNRLLTTKFNIPRLRPNLVERQCLLQKMDAGLQSGSILTLICAPAGYGKTTLASAWVQNKLNTAWLSLNPEDSDPRRFLNYLTAALQKINPTIGEGLQSILEMPQQPPIEMLIGELINDLGQMEQTAILVLDDYHVIHSSEVHDILNFLVDNFSENLHLLITTRENPPLPLSRLRARGQMTEIRAGDLSFSQFEIAEFCQNNMHVTLPDPILAHIAHLTEGWIAGLQLAGLAFQGSGELDTLIETFGGSHRFIMDYLMDEVLKYQPEEIRNFLKRTSVLDRFNAGLCSSVTGMPASVCSAMLDDLEKKNLFLVPLDASRDWYRYHHLFGDILHGNLPAELESDIHRKAAVWFEGQSLISDALTHYMAASDMQSAALMVDKAASQMLNQGEMHTLLGWMATLPEDELFQHENLPICQAAAYLFSGEAGKAVGILNRLQNQGRTVFDDGRILTLGTLINLYSGKTTSLLEDARAAVKMLPVEETFFRAVALQVLATAYQWNGNYTESSAAYEQAYLLGRQMNNPFAELSAMANLVYDLIDMGQMQKAEALCLQAIPKYLDHRNRPLPILGLVYNPLCTIRFEQNRLDEAEQYGRQALELSRKLYSNGMTGGDAETKLVDIAFSRGDFSSGLAIVNRLRQFAREENISFIATKMDLLEISFLLRQGDTIRAGQMIEALEANFENGIPSIHHSLRLMKNQFHLIDKKPEVVLAESEDMLMDFRQEGVHGKLIVLLLQRAQARVLLKNEHAALADLTEAIRLAAPEGYVRQFLRLGAPTALLLKQLHPFAPDFIDSILEAMPGKPQIRHSAQQSREQVERLSEQEARIVQMMSAGLSNQQIAEELFISVGTVKWHVHNILGKLDSDNRAQAVARAREFGVIS